MPLREVVLCDQEPTRHTIPSASVLPPARIYKLSTGHCKTWGNPAYIGPHAWAFITAVPYCPCRRAAPGRRDGSNPVLEVGIGCPDLNGKVKYQVRSARDNAPWTPQSVWTFLLAHCSMPRQVKSCTPHFRCSAPVGLLCSSVFFVCRIARLHLSVICLIVGAREE